MITTNQPKRVLLRNEKKRSATTKNDIDRKRKRERKKKEKFV